MKGYWSVKKLKAQWFIFAECHFYKQQLALPYEFKMLWQPLYYRFNEIKIMKIFFLTNTIFVFIYSRLIRKALDKIAIIKALRNDRRMGQWIPYFWCIFCSLILTSSLFFSKHFIFFLNQFIYQLSEKGFHILGCGEK